MHSLSKTAVLTSLLLGLCLTIAPASEDSHIAHVQTLDLEGWFDTQYTADPRVFGNWKTDELVLQLNQSPLGGNIVFVAYEERLIPGFLADWKGLTLLIAGTHATEDLKLKPRSFVLNLSVDNQSMVSRSLTHLDAVEDGFDSLQSFLEALNQHHIGGI